MTHQQRNEAVMNLQQAFEKSCAGQLTQGELMDFMRSINKQHDETAKYWAEYDLKKARQAEQDVKWAAIMADHTPKQYTQAEQMEQERRISESMWADQAKGYTLD